MTRDISKLAVGQVVYTAMCYEHGGMLDDGTVFRLGKDNFRWIGGDEFGGEHLRQLCATLGLKAWVRGSTDQLHNVQVQGPKSRDILKDIVWTAAGSTSVAELGWFRFCIGRIGNFKGAPVIVSRTGYTGELGYEVFCHPGDAKTVFDAIWEAGQPLGLKPLGLHALDMLRIEAGLAFAGHEFNDQTDPFEAGIGFTAPKSKEADFLGKAALARRRENPREKLVGLEIASRDAAGHGDAIYSGRARVGVITSAMRSPVLDKTIALARVDASLAAIGTSVEVGKLDGHQKRYPAVVVRFPHYDPDKTRVRIGSVPPYHGVMRRLSRNSAWFVDRRISPKRTSIALSAAFFDFGSILAYRSAILPAWAGLVAAPVIVRQSRVELAAVAHDLSWRTRWCGGGGGRCEQDQPQRAEHQPGWCQQDPQHDRVPRQRMRVALERHLRQAKRAGIEVVPVQPKLGDRQRAFAEALGAVVDQRDDRDNKREAGEEAQDDHVQCLLPLDPDHRDMALLRTARKPRHREGTASESPIGWSWPFSRACRKDGAQKRTRTSTPRGAST